MLCDWSMGVQPGDRVGIMSTTLGQEQLLGRIPLVPAILTAVESLATVGEISDTLRQTFGEYQESVVI